MYCQIQELNAVYDRCRFVNIDSIIYIGKLSEIFKDLFIYSRSEMLLKLSQYELKST